MSIWLRPRSKPGISPAKKSAPSETPVTAEYNMLPTATKERTTREVKLGKQSGRSMEIQRLIGRSLRSIIDLKKLPNIQITIDCDVIQADGGTRTASITGAFIALYIAIRKLIDSGTLKQNPIFDKVAAISAGLLNEGCFLDLDFIEDSNAVADANFIFSEKSGIVEIQVSGEKGLSVKKSLMVYIKYLRMGFQNYLKYNLNIQRNGKYNKN